MINKLNLYLKLNNLNKKGCFYNLATSKERKAIWLAVDVEHCKYFSW